MRSCPQKHHLLKLSADGSNFLEWVNDAKVLLSAEDFAKTLTKTKPSDDEAEDTTTTPPVAPMRPKILEVAKWHTLMILRRHLDHALRLQYL